MKSFLTTFQETDGTWSWARVGASVTVLASVFCLIFLVVKNHALPDPLTLGALATFATFPYGANKVAQTVTNFGKTQS
jgi:uncharacterized BrkB/YihY/UPF0761 family membrane protein